MSGCSKSWSGCNFSDCEKAYYTWVIKPNHDRMLWMLIGVEKLTMVSMNFSHGMASHSPLLFQILWLCPAQTWTCWSGGWCHYNLINEASPLFGKTCSANHLTKGENHLHILLCTSWGDAALQWNFITTKFPMVWWKWWNDGHIYKGEYCNDHFNSQKNFPFCSC